MPCFNNKSLTTCFRERLEAWLEEKGKTPSRYHHLKCFGHELSAKKTKVISKTRNDLSPEQLQEQVVSFSSTLNLSVYGEYFQ